MKRRPEVIYRGPRVAQPPSAAFREFAAIARSEKSPTVAAGSVLPETSSPAQQISRKFAAQSYFSDALGPRAILQQNRNSPIVESTVKEEQIPGYAIGLHPSSQTPIAVQFKIGGQPTSSQALVLRPGQIVRPHGLPRGMARGQFSGFYWGLPFGWLGGGNALVFVFSTADADVSWVGDAEVIYHRLRMPIVAADAVATDAPLNYPLSFPWTQAFRGTDNISQQGMPSLSISRPTKMLMRLRVPSLTNPASMRFVFQGTNDFDTDENDALVLTGGTFRNFTWGSYDASTSGGNLANQYPLEFAPSEIIRLAADNGGFYLTSTDSALVGQFVDITRYGHI